MLVIKPTILMLCWEFEGYNNPQTAALVRRPRYFADALVRDGYEVTVIFSCKQQVDTTQVFEGGGKLRLISVPEVTQPRSSISLINKLYTSYSILRFGDFSGEWHYWVDQKIAELNLQFHIAVSFFTPRGPLFSAYKLKKKYDFKSVMDFQDPYYEGLSNKTSRDLLKKSFRRVVKSADAISCVNKTWSKEIEQDFDVKVQYIPHVVEAKVEMPPVERLSKKKVIFFYSGSIDEDLQNPKLFFESLESLHASGMFEEIEFRYAGNKWKDAYFSDNLPKGIKYRFLGWLPKEALYQEINSADIICVFPVVVQAYKTFVPSKFYEFCRFEKPIMIVGNDTGVFKAEFDDAFDKKYIVRSRENFMRLLEEFNDDNLQGFFFSDETFMHEHSIASAYQSFKKLLGC